MKRVKKSEVILISPSFFPNIEIGGPTTYLKDLAEELAIHANLKVLTTDLGCKYDDIKKYKSEISKKFDISYSSSALRNGISLNFAIKIFRSVKSNRILFVHSFFTMPVLLVLFITVFTRNKVFISPHGSLMSCHFFSKSIIKKVIYSFFAIPLLLLSNSKFIFSSRQEMESLVFFLKFIKSKISPNCISKDSIKKFEDVDINFNDRKISLLYLGRYSHEKKIEKIFLLLSRLNKRLNVVFCGLEENDLISIDGLVKEVSTFHSVKFIPFTKDRSFIDNLLMNSKTIIVPSKCENFSHSALEAYLSGAHILSFNKIGIFEYLESSAYSIIDSNSHESLLLAINNLNQHERKNIYTFSAQKVSQSLISLFKNEN